MKSTSNKKDIDNAKRNPDPITSAPGFHPVGTGVGAAAGGAMAGLGAVAAGAAIGTTVGPVGTAVGAAVGAVVGGYIGKSIAEEINPSVEEEYWRENYVSRLYVEPGADYDKYSSAYRYGWESRSQYADKKFEDIEADLSRKWNEAKGDSGLDWDDARNAARDAYDRVASSRREE